MVADSGAAGKLIRNSAWHADRTALDERPTPIGMLQEISPEKPNAASCISLATSVAHCPYLGKTDSGRSTGKRNSTSSGSFWLLSRTLVSVRLPLMFV